MKESFVFISNKEEAIVFKAIGFQVYIIKSQEEVKNILSNLTLEQVVLAYDTEIKDMLKTYIEHKKNLYPLLLELPFNKEDKGMKIFEIKEKIKKSIGIDLL